MQPATTTSTPRDTADPPAARGARSGLKARSVVWAGSALALLLLALVAAFIAHQRNEDLRAQASRSALLARVLEEHATRSIDTAALALAALGEVVATSRIEGDDALGWVLNQALAGLPVLRSVAVLDEQGKVLTSTEAGLRQQALDLRPLGPLPDLGRDSLGTFVAGRGLSALLLQGQAEPVPAGVGFLPLVRRLQSSQGVPLLLLGLINPDAIANHQQQLLSEEGASAVLLSLQGQVLAATAAATALPGSRVDRLPVIARYLPGVEHGGYVGSGTGTGEQVVAFRMSRTRPVVVVVETALDTALVIWERDSRRQAALAAVAAAMIGLMTLLASRSSLAREAAQRQRDDAQAQVARRERDLSVVVGSVQELLFRTDTTGRLVFASPRWQGASGLGQDQLLGSKLADLVHPGSAAAVATLVETAGGDDVRSAVVRLGPAGSEREFEMVLTPLHEGGQQLGFAGSAVDVTEQRQAQARVRSQLAFTELLLDVLPLPLSTLDRQGCYLSVNQAWQEFMGRTRAEVMGRPARGYQLPADALVHDHHDRALMSQGGRVRYEARARHADGTLRDLAVTKAAVPGEDGLPAGILVAFTDVTEFRQAERATREARDAAVGASRAKTEFIGNISHELRTPLQSILGFSELGHSRSGEQRRLGTMFGEIHAAGMRMLALVNDLLDVAKIESAIGTFHLERTELRALVNEVVSELAPQIEARQLVLQQHWGETVLLAQVDPLRLQQVLRNVLANAIRFSQPGRPLVVSGQLDADDCIRLCVTDQGPGIPEAELEQIFEAFVQSSRTKDGSGGTGLGLAISRKIMQAHGGQIVARNNAGGGATFVIELPARAPALAETL